jgi:hypothetical protein
MGVRDVSIRFHGELHKDAPRVRTKVLGGRVFFWR